LKPLIQIVALHHEAIERFSAVDEAICRPRRGITPVRGKTGLATGGEASKIGARPWDESDALWLAIKTRVLCIYWAIGAKMIHA
jgi:hypothetical protein